MVKNYLSLELGGKTRGLKFNIGTLKCMKEISGDDPLELKAEGSDLFSLLPFAERVLHAALLANCLSKKEAADFTADDVAEWMNELDVPTITDIVNLYTGIFTVPKSSANGEVSKDTQPVIV